MQSTTYKLTEYKITENEHGDLWWETHIGLGSLRVGKCFINRDILFIRPRENKGPGFLKGGNLIKAMITGRKQMI